MSEPVAIAVLAGLDRASLGLGLPQFPRRVRAALEEALPFPGDDPRYLRNALVPGDPPLEISFAEGQPKVLRIDFEPGGPGRDPAERRTRAVETFRHWIADEFHQSPPPELESSLIAIERQALGPTPKFGAFLGATSDGRGLAEAKIYCELPYEMPGGFGERLAPIADKALADVPGLTPHFASVSCGRERCDTRIYFLCREEVPVLGLETVLADAGLMHRLPELASAAVGLVGADGVLPGGATVLSFRERAGRIDGKLEIILASLSASPAAIARYVELSASLRPDMRRDLLRWSRALGGQMLLPERLNAVGFRVSVSSPAQIGLYVTPTWWWGSCPP